MLKFFFFGTEIYYWFKIRLYVDFTVFICTKLV